MVKIGLTAVVVCVIGISLAYPQAKESTKSAESNSAIKSADAHQVTATARQGGALAGILGSIGTALVPIFGAILGPILTNLASGIASAFNNGLNVSRNRTPTAEAQALLIRIPQDSPLYAALVQGQLITPDVKEDLPAVSNSPATPAGKNPYKLAGKLGNVGPTEPAPIENAEPILTHDADAPEPPTTPVKRIPQRKRPEIDYL